MSVALQLDLTAPSISLVQDGKRIRIDDPDKELSGARYFITTNSTQPTSTCVVNTTDNTINETVFSTAAPNKIITSDLADTSDDYWVCFAAKNKKGVFGAADRQYDKDANDSNCYCRA